MRANYAVALYNDAAATLDDLREAVATHEDTLRIARRVLGGTHPTTKELEGNLQYVRAMLRVRSLLPYGACAVVAVIAWGVLT